MPRLDLDRVFRLEFSETKDFDEFFTVTNIVAGSMKLDRILTDKDLKFGSFFSDKFEVQIYDRSNLANLFIRLICIEDGVTKPLFFGVVDSCTKDYSDTYRDIVAYDMAYYYGKKNAAWAWNLFWANKQAVGETSCTLGQMRQFIVDTFNIPAVLDYTYEEDMIMSYTIDITSISIVAMLSMLYAVSGVYLHFDAEGTLRLVSLVNITPEDPVPSIEGEYEKENSIFEEVEVAYYTNTQLYDVLGNVVYDTDENPDEDRDRQIYTVTDNLFIEGINSVDRMAVGDATLEGVLRLKYTPASVKMIVSDLDIKLGDKLRTSQGDFFVFHETLSGPLLVEQTLEAKANIRNDETSVETSLATEMLKKGGGSGGGLIDIMSNIVICAGIITVGAFQATLGMHVVVDNRNIRVPDVTYNTAYVEDISTSSDVESMALQLRTEYDQEGEVASVDSGYLAVVEFDDTDFQDNIYMEVLDEG